mmetsp:Transcript_6/g.7  ORF Transcript_6/g.7 Transcript_6/m.7 type:complete len:259 (+) Transcript_6:1157-1933(+)
MGLAAAMTLHLALRLTWMPALAMVTVCCSMTSWMATLSMSPILSNSSMHTTPLSASTIAPASKCFSPVSLSIVTAAVNPTPDEPLPVVLMAKGAMSMMCRRSCDFAVEGSPTISKLISPLRWVPLGRFFSAPPRSCRRMAFLTRGWPSMEGATEWAMRSKTSFSLASFLMFLMSDSLMEGFSCSALMFLAPVATIMFLKTPVVVPDTFVPKHLKTPVTSTLSPGLTLSTRSFSRTTCTDLGSWPVGALSGISWMVSVW